MKKFFLNRRISIRILVPFFLYFVPILLSAQDWIMVKAFQPSQTLHCIRFANQDVGYTVSTLYNGSTYNIHKTTDGGATWMDQSSGFTATRFKDIHIFSEDTVMMCGNYGLVISTFDGGETWLADTVAPNGDHLFGISFVGHTGYVCGNSGAIFKTTNMGETWTQINPPLISAIEEIYFLAEDFGFICGLNFIYYTEDGGGNWVEPESFPGATTNWWLREFSFVSNSTGFVCGDIGQLYKTLDGGKNWIYLDNTPTTESLQSMKALDENRIYACGFGGTVIRSSDGGVHWEQMTAGSAQHFRSMDFTPEGTGFICTQIGEVLKYSDPWLGIDDNQPEDEIVIYPNPVADYVYFSFCDESQFSSEVSLYNLSGVLVGTYRLDKALDVSFLTDGIYFLHFISSDGPNKIRLLVKK
ncbi:MAG: T9SS type A sorting domain-containing protein [Bacteroidales bacterium]|nr:T9SS type A sorting domain-containing protein [Bacteroidales bacterium]